MVKFRFIRSEIPIYCQQTINEAFIYKNASFIFIIKGFVYKNKGCVYSWQLPVGKSDSGNEEVYY